ncbi:MAG: spore coat U domain-containing protein [Breoghania sp.]|nr:spore coat U domain-containing protein [Breoghania sp.]
MTLAYADGETVDCDSQSGTTSATGTLTVSASVDANCLVDASDLSFGETGVISEPIELSADISITYTPGASYSVAMGDGLYYSGSSRRMESDSGDYVTYGLYQDSSRSTEWGNTTSVDTVDGIATGDDDLVVYGLVPAQSATAGDYSDTVTVVFSD